MKYTKLQNGYVCVCVSLLEMVTKGDFTFSLQSSAFFITIRKYSPWLVWLSGLSTGLQTKGLLVQFPVRVHAWVLGQVPSWGHSKDNHTMMFLSLSFSLPSPLWK